MDGRNTFTREELIAFLTGIIESRRPKILRAQDTSDLHGSDHVDHVAGGRFALDAHLRAADGPRELRLYRACNISGEAENVHAGEADEKWTTFMTYAPHDSHMCDSACMRAGAYGTWASRQYVIASVRGRAGALLASGQCVETSGGSARLAACNDAPSQSWSITPTGTVKNGANLCLQAEGTKIMAKACSTGTREQRLVLFTNGQLRGMGGACADTTPAGELALVSCADRAQQLFFLGLEHPATLRSTTAGRGGAGLVCVD